MKRFFLAIVMIFLANGLLFAQTVEERKGGTSIYSVTAGAGTDEYQWTIVVGDAPVSINPVPSSGDGSVATPYIIDWDIDQNSITVEWAADADPNTASSTAVVTAQIRTNDGAVCPSVVQTMNITFWSNPGAEIATGQPDLAVCSGDAINGSITIDLAGAPDAGESGNDGFNVIYDVAVEHADLSTSSAVGEPGTGKVASSDGPDLTIPLPENLVNAGSSPLEYTITLVSVEDDFENGPYAIAGQVFTITVNPVPVTGPITSDGALTRRN